MCCAVKELFLQYQSSCMLMTDKNVHNDSADAEITLIFVSGLCASMCVCGVRRHLSRASPE